MEIKAIEEKMQKAIGAFEQNLKKVRTGRANPNIFVGSWFSIRGFVGSFFFDYESVGMTAGTEGWDDVEVWLLTSESTGREQANAISSMIYEAQNEAIQKIGRASCRERV